MFRATLCPSSGADDWIVFSPPIRIVLWQWVVLFRSVCLCGSICSVFVWFMVNLVWSGCVWLLCGVLRVVVSMLYAGVIQCVSRLSTYLWLQWGCQNRLTGSVSIEELVAQLVLLARVGTGGWLGQREGLGWLGIVRKWVFRFCESNVCRIVCMLLVNVGCGVITRASLCCILFRIRVYCLVCAVHLQIVGYCFWCTLCVRGNGSLDYD